VWPSARTAGAAGMLEAGPQWRSSWWRHRRSGGLEGIEPAPPGRWRRGQIGGSQSGGLDGSEGGRIWKQLIGREPRAGNHCCSRDRGGCGEAVQIEALPEKDAECASSAPASGRPRMGCFTPQAGSWQAVHERSGEHHARSTFDSSPAGAAARGS